VYRDKLLTGTKILSFGTGTYERHFGIITSQEKYAM
jgi:hypothetical protein